MVTIDGTDISGATIDGEDVQEITADGDVVWVAFNFPESFEDGSAAPFDTDHVATTNRSYDGSWSIETNANPSISQATVYAGGSQPNSLEVYWQETSNQTGHSIDFFNSNGNIEHRAGTNNPQWEISDGDGDTTVSQGDGYNRWILFHFDYDWANNQYTYTFQDEQAGLEESGTRSLNSGTDIADIRLGDYWGSSSDSWWDLFQENTPTPDPLVNTVSFTDSFSDGTYTDGWNALSGTWDASNNYLENTSSNNNESIARDEGTHGWYGYWELDHNHGGQFYGGQTMLFGDGTTIGNSDNCWWIQFKNSNANYERSLYKQVNGTTTEMASFGTFDQNWHTFRVERDEDGSWRGYANGTQQFSFTDTDVSTEQPYFLCQGDNSGHKWDNFDVESKY